MAPLTISENTTRGQLQKTKKNKGFHKRYNKICYGLCVEFKLNCHISYYLSNANSDLGVAILPTVLVTRLYGPLALSNM